VHTLRHSAAVAWLEAGVHIKAVADLLGHSSIAITGDICGHTSDNTARAAVEGLAAQLGILDF
jgi:site-specific recombinase XerD